MQPEDSLLFTQEPILGQMNPFHILIPCLFKISFNDAHMSEVVSVLQVFELKFFTHFSCPPCVLHVPTTSPP
jgi:hypothetical protein